MDGSGGPYHISAAERFPQKKLGDLLKMTTDFRTVDNGINNDTGFTRLVLDLDNKEVSKKRIGNVELRQFAISLMDEAEVKGLTCNGTRAIGGKELPHDKPRIELEFHDTPADRALAQQLINEYRGQSKALKETNALIQ